MVDPVANSIRTPTWPWSTTAITSLRILMTAVSVYAGVARRLLPICAYCVQRSLASTAFSITLDKKLEFRLAGMKLNRRDPENASSAADGQLPSCSCVDLRHFANRLDVTLVL